MGCHNLIVRCQILTVGKLVRLFLRSFDCWHEIC